MKELEQKLEKQLKKIVEDWQVRVNKFQTNRAHPSLVDNLQVEVYGSRQSLNTLASVVVVEPTVLQIKPFNPEHIKPINDAIHENQEIDLSPNDDGQAIYLPLPPLTGERRQQIVKKINLKQEDYLIKARLARQQIRKNLKDIDPDEEQQRQSLISIDEITKKHQTEIETIGQAKVNEILKV